MKSYSESYLLTMRVPVKLREKIVEDIELEGDFTSISQWMQAAAREFLESRENKRSLRGGGGSTIIKPSLKPFPREFF